MNWPDFIDYFFKVVVIAGGGYLLILIKYSFEREIANYKTQIEILEATQIDKYLDKINKLKEYHEMVLQEREKEIDKLNEEIDKYPKLHYTKDEIIGYLNKFIEELSISERESWEDFLDQSFSDKSLSLPRAKQINIDEVLESWGYRKKNDT